MTAFTKETFEKEVLQSKNPVLVDFWAEWCGPCRTLGPIVEELAKDNEGKEVMIGKLNIDDEPELTEKYGVMSIPTIIIFKDGKEVKRVVGVQSKDALQQLLDEQK